jgi:hypothetical protein
MLEWGADLVHDHTLIGPVYAQRFPDLPVVTTNHGPFNAELADLYGVIGQDVPIIAISHDQARSAGDVPIAAVIHHGIDLDVYPFGEGDGDERGDYLLFLGRMTPEKGVRRAIAGREGDRRPVDHRAKMREPLEHEFFTTQILPLLDEKIGSTSARSASRRRSAAHRRQGAGQPDPLAGAVRPGDDRGARLRHPGAVVQRGLGSGDDRPRGHRVPRRRH